MLVSVETGSGGGGKYDHSAGLIVPSAHSRTATSTAGVEVSLEVTYEPSKLGDLRTALFLTSSAGGDFVCPLFGHCSLPRPQGPVTIKASTGGASIVFKNVFAASSTFTFAVDNPSFAVKPSETVAGKKSVTIVVNYKAQNAVKTAKLTISHPSGTTWVYYIKAL